MKLLRRRDGAFVAASDRLDPNPDGGLPRGELPSHDAPNTRRNVASGGLATNPGPRISPLRGKPEPVGTVRAMTHTGAQGSQGAAVNSIGGIFDLRAIAISISVDPPAALRSRMTAIADLFTLASQLGT